MVPKWLRSNIPDTQIQKVSRGVEFSKPYYTSYEYDGKYVAEDLVIVGDISAEKLILDVSQHVYRDVRTETCTALDEIISNRADLCNKCCKILVGSLKRESPSNNHALGTLSVLMKKRILFSMRHDWEFLKEFYVSLFVKNN